MSLFIHSKQAQVFWGCVALFLGTFTAYYPTMQAEFIWDDEGYFIEDPLMTAEGGLKKIWTAPEENNGYWPYLPITRSTFWLERQIWGLDFKNAHTVNIILHLCVSILLWLGLRRFSIRGAWVMGLLFAVHPVHVQSVAWITERKNVLSGIFFLLALWSYFHFKELKQARWYLFSIGMFLCAVLSKTSTVILPIVAELGCLWLFPTKRWTRRTIDFWPIFPFLAIALIVSIVRIWFEQVYFGANAPQFDLNHWQRIVIATHTPFFYLQKLFFPEPLIFFYSKWDLDLSQVSTWLPLLSLCGIIGISGWKYYQWGGRILLGTLAYLVMLLPVMGLFNNAWHRFSYVADHWVYLPSMVVMILAVQGGLSLGENINLQISRYHFFLPMAGLGLSLLLGTLTWHQTRIYQNSEILNKDTVEKNPKAWGAYNGLGSIYLKQKDYVRAIDYFSKAAPGANVLTGDSSPYLNRGRAYSQLKQYDRALEDFNQVILLQPDNFHSYHDRGLVYIKKKQYELAERDFTQAIVIKPDWPTAYQNRGNLRLLLKQYLLAFEDFNRAIQLSPEQADLYHQRGSLQLKMFNNKKAACTDWKEACLRGTCKNFELAVKKKDCSP